MANDSDMAPAATVDALGLYCPMPIVMMSKEIKKIEVGQVLAVLADDAGIEADLPAWCNTTGHKMLGLTVEGKVYTGLVRRTK